MWTIGPLGFAVPWLLLGLLALPILWLILRAVPPAPIRRRFPGVALLLGLKDDEQQTDKTPWWLLLLRMLAVGAAIIGFAGPVLNPDTSEDGTGPLLIVMDGTWADAPDWSRRIARVDEALTDAQATGRETAIVVLTDLPAEGGLPLRAADAWSAALPGLQPAPWLPDSDALAAWAATLDEEVETFWLSDGLSWDGREALRDRLADLGEITVFQSARPVMALRPARWEDGQIVLEAVRSRADGPDSVTVAAHGLDPAGTPRDLATATLGFAPSETVATASIALQPELRNRITRFEIQGLRSAGAVSLADDGLRRREIAILSPRDEREGLQLLSPTHYLEQALIPNTDIIDGSIDDIVLANPDVIIMADIAQLGGTEPEAIEGWVRNGGLLLRFAGPRLAASDVGRSGDEPLMPVRLRIGGRNVGGAMSWGEPKTLRAFGPDSPFFGLTVPEDVTVSAQVMAEPDPTLAERTIATLADGTPLVTRKRLDEGQVVLFHVTANAEWSSLPLSGLFVSMLERLAVSSRPSDPSAADLAGTSWTLDQAITAFGRVEEAGTMPGVPGERLAEGGPGRDLPPGLYAGEDRRLALNVATADTAISEAVWPDGTRIEGLATVSETPLKGIVLSAALAFLLADVLAALWLSGRLSGPRAGQAAAVLLALVLAATQPGAALAQSEEMTDTELERALRAASEVTLAYVVTGNDRVDQVSEAGLRGLSRVLFRRTSIEPIEPTAVNLEFDELSVFPFLYWPVTPDQPRPSLDAYANLNRYLRTGGMILFDTRDADTARFGGTSPNGRKLQELALPLDIPPLEPVPSDHVLTRTFYLLQDFPGRHISRDVWVEASPADAERAEGMPFRNLNDNVTPVVIGGNDWASAWAVDDSGVPIFPVGRGFAGERQREIAYRFGVNLVMHVLTGNYKSDQVHVPALLDRLGQ